MISKLLLVRLTARLPEDLHAALEARARLEARSLNSMLVVLLRAGLREQRPGPEAADDGEGRTNGA